MQRRINHQLLVYRMSRQFPGEQVLIPRLLLSVCARVDPAIVRFDLAVVVLDRVGDTRCTCYGGFRDRADKWLHAGLRRVLRIGVIVVVCILLACMIYTVEECFII